ncbi:uncharacterized protein N7496_007300 [Penicillium cataractarum]|uniref:Integrase core domain-containing protein n=1 Tax=Penicillium cataractarum TaxID=2100454 RepID=A0A9W9S366_9EURO|nr:uncharacterized protein N7496_007300 [Penicillium cataractarum]KAJ5371208.1 hypothetical protein N7496_007300 [Penicillium cataractarum]
MGIPSSERSLCRIRQKLGVKLRVDNAAERASQERLIERILTAEDQIGDIEGYGRRYQQIHLRSQGVFIARDRAYEIYRTINPDGIDDRRSGFQRRRGAYICDGPNAIWHLDGYMKLEPFGIEIYAAIDGHSRYVIWIYIGISARTAVSVLRQYLDCVKSNGYIPRKLRVDLGSETVLIGDAHVALRESLNAPPSPLNAPPSPSNAPPSPSNTPPLPSDTPLSSLVSRFRNYFIYGRSIDNQRIESWWGQLAQSSIFVYHEYFNILLGDGIYLKQCIPEQIVLLAIYMPILRSRVQSYVSSIWNVHPIRKQPKRPHIVSGKPIMNYYYPTEDTPDCKESFDPSLLQRLQEDVAEWDPTEYLPPSTLDWCRLQMVEIGQQEVGEPFDPEDPLIQLLGDRKQPYRKVYETMRARALLHYQSGTLPILALSMKPTGAFSWGPSGQWHQGA